MTQMRNQLQDTVPFVLVIVMKRSAFVHSGLSGVSSAHSVSEMRKKGNARGRRRISYQTSTQGDEMRRQNLLPWVFKAWRGFFSGVRGINRIETGPEIFWLE